MSQAFNLKSQLKTSYITYLQNLCHNNNIDIQSLKTTGQDQQHLEMFFGGFPVLVGLKYFINLKTLKLFGQQITCLRPLAEISTTLEELWICEGQLKNIQGIEECNGLKRLHLYDNQILDANLISHLQNLEVLCLQGNQLQSLKFIEKLVNLHYLDLGSNKLGDKELCSIFVWPAKLRFLNLSGNSFKTFQSLIPLTICTSLCHLSFASVYEGKAELVYTDHVYGWLSYHFRFLETLDDDEVQENFFSTFTTKTCILISTCYATVAKLEDDLHHNISIADKHAHRATCRLTRFCEILEKLLETIPVKDVKRDVVRRMLDASKRNLGHLKHLKRDFKKIAEFSFQLNRYRIGRNLEAACLEFYRDTTDEDINHIKHFLNFNCSSKQSYEIVVKTCFLKRQILKNDLCCMAFIDKNSDCRTFSEVEALLLLDGFFHQSNRTVRIFIDFDLIYKNKTETQSVFAVPIVLLKQAYDRKAETTRTKDISIESHELELLAVVMVEVIYPEGFSIEHLRYNDKFDEVVDAEVKKLQDLQINIDMKDEKVQLKTDANASIIDESFSERKSGKIQSVSDVTNGDALKGRWSTSSQFTTRHTVRNYLELCLTFSDMSHIQFSSNIYEQITCLDLSNLKLSKLTGIEQFPNLVNLSLKNNRINSTKRLRGLEKLFFLDLSFNRLHKVEGLPPHLKHMNLSSNHIISLCFSTELKVLENLDVSRNQLKSLKGIEHCVELRILCANDNHLKEKSELEFLKSCINLSYIDFTRNKITSADGYRSRILMQFPSLSALDRELVPVEDRVLTHKKAGRGLTLELISKYNHNLEEITNISLSGQKLEIIVMDDSCFKAIMHLTHLDLSKNQFENLKELGILSNLKVLNLSNNNMRILWSHNNGDSNNNDFIPYQSLEVLNLCGNNLANNMLPLLGLQYLRSLKVLNLEDNVLHIFESTYFDLPNLQEIYLKRNVIKNIKKKFLGQLTILDLSCNRLKDINNLIAPNLCNLNISQNSLVTCAALKSLTEMTTLRELTCSGNPVTSHRVYLEFIKSKIPQIELLDGKPITETSDVKKLPIESKKRNSHLSSLTWMEMEETWEKPNSDSRNANPFDNLLAVSGVRMTKHRKPPGS